MDAAEWVAQASRPRIRPELVTEQLVDGRVRIGGTTYTVAGDIEDPTGAVWTLVQALDGTRPVEQLTAEVSAAHAGVSRDDIRAGLCALADAGYLDDAEEIVPEGLSRRERQRYDRGRCFYRWVDSHPRQNFWEPQMRLRQAAVTVVGMGGTGGSAALSLVCSGVGRVHCVDHDVVELSNLNRQILFTEADIGQSKVDVAVRHLREHNSDVTVTAQQLRITGTEDFAKLVPDCDVLVLAADTPGEIRVWANRACLAAETPWVDGGYHGPSPNTTFYVPGQGPCYECAWRHHLESVREQGMAGGDLSARRISSNAVTAPVATISGQLMAHQVLSWLTGSMPVVPGQLRGVDMLAADHLFLIDNPQYPDCLACGDARLPGAADGEGSQRPSSTL